MTAPVGGSNAVATNTATTSVDRPDQMDKDTFLKLLVAQMRYQDPSNPTDPTQFMSQTAAFSQVEKLDQLVQQNASIVALQKTMNAGVIVGHTVTYTDDNGAAQTGAVTSVLLGDDTTPATATIGGKSVPLGRITQVS
ncbi:flagellar hook assembly protein FlgD [Petropleomorpha daqingensis]|uniref:Flagellar basal-body rod modification protein FlgD n=1 Tax=Petropleomorpha daqingensis TaxID=2026353 RepID=A0A853CJ70_9ACTN|nr:flagellar hook capping FlgD N-terminal domain-containing protein [Petropleomorpha daqingensis]NYJ06328.1 flagellar basal-body rod modification protein FlgD [Petropleomorpha daqingensis]